MMSRAASVRTIGSPTHSGFASPATSSSQTSVATNSCNQRRRRTTAPARAWLPAAVVICSKNGTRRALTRSLCGGNSHHTNRGNGIASTASGYANSSTVMPDPAPRRTGQQAAVGIRPIGSARQHAGCLRNLPIAVRRHNQELRPLAAAERRNLRPRIRSESRSFE